MQNRLKSWALWVSVASLFALVLKAFFDYEIPNYNALVNTALTVAVGFGIVNNPTNKEGF